MGEGEAGLGTAHLRGERQCCPCSWVVVCSICLILSKFAVTLRLASRPEVWGRRFGLQRKHVAMCGPQRSLMLEPDSTSPYMARATLQMC